LETRTLLSAREPCVTSAGLPAVPANLPEATHAGQKESLKLEKPSYPEVNTAGYELGAAESDLISPIGPA